MIVSSDLSSPAVCDRSVLETAEDCFVLLVTGPDPLCIDGRLIPGLPDRRIALHLLRTRLAAHRYPRKMRDAVWAHLLLRARAERLDGHGSAWTVACVGVAMAELSAIAGYLAARYDTEPADMHAAVLAGFLTEMGRITTTRPRILLRLRLAAYRAGRTLGETLNPTSPTCDTPITAGHGRHRVTDVATGITDVGLRP